MNKITKTSTIYKRQRAESPEKFENERDKFLEVMVNSRPKMNVTINISRKIF